jgi:RNA polymerase sigma-70 factor (ECF subfamily)
MKALAKLNEVQRDVVLLHDLEGWRHAEIALHLDLSEGMSRRHLSDSRKELRELLGDYATLEPDHD